MAAVDKLTAAGTVADLHGIPYYPQGDHQCGKDSNKDIVNGEVGKFLFKDSYLPIFKLPMVNFKD